MIALVSIEWRSALGIERIKKPCKPKSSPHGGGQASSFVSAVRTGPCRHCTQQGRTLVWSRRWGRPRSQTKKKKPCALGIEGVVALLSQHSPPGLPHRTTGGILVDPASSHMLVSKIKPCMSKFTPLYGETANGSLNQSRFLR